MNSRKKIPYIFFLVFFEYSETYADPSLIEFQFWRRVCMSLSRKYPIHFILNQIQGDKMGGAGLWISLNKIWNYLRILLNSRSPHCICSGTPFPKNDDKNSLLSCRIYSSPATDNCLVLGFNLHVRPFGLPCRYILLLAARLLHCYHPYSKDLQLKKVLPLYGMYLKRSSIQKRSSLLMGPSWNSKRGKSLVIVMKLSLSLSM